MSVTLEWKGDPEDKSGAAAFELQWRQRGKELQEWTTSPQLILATACRKRNLAPATCYEFRVRAASTWGWSAYCDPLMVVTANADDERAANAAEAAAAASGPGGGKAAAAAATRAAKADGAAGGMASPPAGSGAAAARANGARGKPSTPRDRTGSAAAEEAPWECVVCKRKNDEDAARCTVCGTKQSYAGKRFNNIKPDTGGAGGDSPSAHGARGRRRRRRGAARRAAARPRTAAEPSPASAAASGARSSEARARRRAGRRRRARATTTSTRRRGVRRGERRLPGLGAAPSPGHPTSTGRRRAARGCSGSTRT